MPTSRRPGFVYFDMGNVLLLFDHEIACRQLAHLTGQTASRMRAVIFQSGLQWRYERGELSGGEFYELFCAQTGSRPDYDAFVQAAGAIFTLHEPVVELVTALRSAGWRLGVLSNTCEAHWHHARAPHFSALWSAFERFALSFELQALKPEPAIYRAAAALAESAPKEIFFVDDRPENVVQARQLGWDAVLFTTPAQLQDDLRQRDML